MRGVIDAVFQHPDGTWDVVDWKTNREQTADPVQLAIYRLGWAQRVGVEPDEVLTAFVYVRDGGEVVRPALPSIEDIASRVGAVSAVVSGGITVRSRRSLRSDPKPAARAPPLRARRHRRTGCGRTARAA